MGEPDPESTAAISIRTCAISRDRLERAAQAAPGRRQAPDTDQKRSS